MTSTTGVITLRPHFWSLLWTLVRTDVKSRYHGTIGGFVWALLKPFTMCVVLLFVFSFLFATDPLYKFNLVIGLFLYDFFGESTKTGMAALHAKGYLIGKARFPYWIAVVASLANAVITLAVFVLVIGAFVIGIGGAGRAFALLWFGGYLA